MLGYDVDPGGGRLVVNEAEAERVRAIFALFEQYGSVLQTLEEIERLGSPHAARRLMAVDGGSQPKARPWAESLRKTDPNRRQRGVQPAGYPRGLKLSTLRACNCLENCH